MPEKKVNVKVVTDVEDSEVDALERKLEDLDNEQINVNTSVDDDSLDVTESEIQELDGTDIDVNVDNIRAMESIEQISQGFDRLKQGASEVGQQMGTLLDSAGKQEMNKAFLVNAVGAEKAKTAMQDINDIVADMPGDDTALQGLLSSAVAKDANLTSDALKNMGVAATDYFSAMSYYGKSATEAQQDMTNYLLAGNTAELERSPILQGHIDKLKEATTVQERSKALQEALNEEHWGGMSQQDTYNNKLETFNGMLERGRYNLGGMFQEGAKYAMDWALQLDESTNGLVGMGIALAGFATPITDTVMGLGQMATGIQSIKGLGFITWLKNLEIASKLSAAATWLQTQAQAALHLVMSLNPIILVAIALIALAAAFIWAYQNVDWFREMVDGAWNSIVQLAQAIYSYISPAITWLSNLFNQFTSQLELNTNDWIQAILGFILFIPTLPLQVGIALVNTLAKVLGFKGNFVQSLISAGANAVTGFIRYITQIPGMVQAEFKRTLGLVNDFINSIPSRVWDMGVAIIDALKSALGIGSPGHMFYMVEGEFNRIDDLTEKTRFDTGSIGKGMVDNFKMDLSNAPGNNGGYANQTINITLNGDVDSEERMNKFLDELTRRLAWDNQTAGRTV